MRRQEKERVSVKIKEIVAPITPTTSVSAASAASTTVVVVVVEVIVVQRSAGVMEGREAGKAIVFIGFDAKN